jgi:beta-glucosidase-like glycosyl hydrolase
VKTLQQQESQLPGESGETTHHGHPGEASTPRQAKIEYPTHPRAVKRPGAHHGRGRGGPEMRCATVWPSGPNLGAAFNATLYRAMGAVTGVELRALNNAAWSPRAQGPAGVDALVLWGPTVNLVRAPQWGRTQETPGEDPWLTGVFAREVVRGLQEGPDPRYLLSAATLKHFAAYSLEDYHAPDGRHYTRETFNAVVSAFDLADSYFPHFALAAKPVSEGGAGAAGAMMAMNSVNGVPALASTELVNILKGWAGHDQVAGGGGGGGGCVGSRCQVR